MSYIKSRKDISLMFGNIEVMRINFAKGIYNVIDHNHVPYGIRGKLKYYEKSDNATTDEIIEERTAINGENLLEMLGWFSKRTLALSRANADRLYAVLGFERLDNIYDKFEFVSVCRAVSVLDKYWIKYSDEDILWDNVDIKRNRLNSILTQVALYGDPLSFRGSYTTPELTTHGLYAKAWRRHDDGYLWMYKLSSEYGDESEKEVMVSNILDKCNVNHVKYVAGMDRGNYVCMCRCISDENNSVLPALEYSSYCSSHGLNLRDEAKRIDSDGYYKMHIIDYLISNNDRHGQNWGFFVDNESFNLVSLHPLYDHNKSFSAKHMWGPRQISNPEYRRLKDNAIEAMKYVDFHFTSAITRSDFIRQEYYDSFMRHSEELGIETKYNPFAEALDKMNQ